jgi:hypothetical protein
MSLPATSHLNPNHPQLKKHRLDNGDYPYENGHMTGELLQKKKSKNKNEDCNNLLNVITTLIYTMLEYINIYIFYNSTFRYACEHESLSLRSGEFIELYV